MPNRAGERSPGVAREDTSELGELSGVLSVWTPRTGRCNGGAGELRFRVRSSVSTCYRIAYTRQLRPNQRLPKALTSLSCCGGVVRCLPWPTTPTSLLNGVMGPEGCIGVSRLNDRVLNGSPMLAAAGAANELVRESMAGGPYWTASSSNGLAKGPSSGDGNHPPRSRWGLGAQMDEARE
jgi:hypothetical protein